MKLLFDHNLSLRLVDRLTDRFPGSLHVMMVGLEWAMDRTIWDYAADNELIIVTKDADFSELSLLLGFPPKVIWIRRGNCTTDAIEAILRHNYDAIIDLDENPETGTLMLF